MKRLRLSPPWRRQSRARRWTLLAGALVGLLATTLPQVALAAQQRPVDPPRPRLIVVIAVDQLRPDYLDRFRPFFGRAGFNLFLRRGASFPAARYAHAVTETCPGHAVILTGSYAMVNGVVANDWYDPRTGREVYCAEDSSAALVGAKGGADAGRSPSRLIGATVGDLLKTATAGRSRVVTVSSKDRSAIMLGGKLADAAYWRVGNGFVTSTYYRADLPAWVSAFNAGKPFDHRVGGTWDRVLPASAYALMGTDDEPAESDIGGLGRTFPHPMRSTEALDATPFPDEVLADFAIAALQGEQLGQDTVPDLLGISFSATDAVGHTFGPDSHEIMDDIVRLDRTLARLFGAIDRAVGLGNVVMVLTADHGVAPLPEVMARGHPDAGARRFSHAIVDSAAARALTARYGPAPPPGWVAYNGAPLLYLNRAALSARRVSLEDAEQTAVAAIREIPGVHEAIAGAALVRLRDAAVGGGPASDVVRSYHPARGGDLYYFLDPYILQTDKPTGTSHGTLWRYDQQVPLLWFGRGIVPGVHRGPAEVADIAPTLAAILGLTAPGGAQGRELDLTGDR